MRPPAALGLTPRGPTADQATTRVAFDEDSVRTRCQEDAESPFAASTVSPAGHLEVEGDDNRAARLMAGAAAERQGLLVRCVSG